MNTTKPLEGKRVVVTRALEQARALKERLEKVGATVLLLPAVSFSEPSDSGPLDAAIRGLGDFDWILFTSANAVRFFANRCRVLRRDFGDGKQPRCAAVGPVTASTAAAEGFLIDYVAKEFLGTALAFELGDALAGKRVLLPRSERAGRDLPAALKDGGANVTEVIAYHTGGIGASEPGVMDALREARVDVISFFSPSAVENLRCELGSDAIVRLAMKTAMAAVGPVTAAAMRNAGMQVAIEATESTAESMAVAIENYFSSCAASHTRSQ